MPNDDFRERWWQDARAVLAILAVVGAFSQQAAMLIVWLNSSRVVDEVPSIPTWQAATVSAIVGFYFGARGGSGIGPNTNGGSP